MDITNQKLKVFAVKHLPIVRAYAEKIGVVQAINQLIPSDMDVSPGIYFLGLILDTLSGRSPLYRLEEFFETQDTELLLGQTVRPKSFNDENVARVMDKAFDVGTTKIFTEIAKRAMLAFNFEGPHYIHFDTTSRSVFGDYDLYQISEHHQPFEITYGHSKDHRPDLKQFIVSVLCVDRNIPIFGKTEDGNASDKTINNDVLSTISKHMAQCGLSEDAFIYIADSAAITEKNLEIINEGNILCISRLSARYNECTRVIKEAVSANEWTNIGTLNETETTQKRPAANYRYHESTVCLYGKDYRVIVFHSSAYDKRRQKRIDRILKKDLKEIEKRSQKASKVQYYCQADAEAAAKRIKEKRSDYYDISTEIIEVPIYPKGRPKDGIKKIKELHYTISVDVKENKDAVLTLREEAGCFVLITNLPVQGENSKDALSVLKAYKEQHGIEQNFGFLKDPMIVNSVFLKKPKRIEVLGLILLLSLLLWRLIEKTMRDHLESTGKKITGWDNKPTDRPTAFMMTTKFANIVAIKIGNQRRLNDPLNVVQLEYLDALGLESNVFIMRQKPG